LTLSYWNELDSPASVKLAAGLTAEDIYLDLSTAGGAQAGDRVQVDSEIVEVEEVLNGGTRYKVTRASHGSNAEAHAAETRVYHLQRKVFVVPFPRDFFGSPASGSYSCPIFLPDVRIASAEFFVTNSKGNSPTAVRCLTGTLDSGVRTLSGGQISIQVEGFLAIQTDAAPPLVVEAAHSMRNILAVVGEAPTGAPIELRLRQNEDTICTLTIPTGSNISNVVDGFGLAPLTAQSRLGLDIVSVGQTAETTPGRDLTVTVRL